VRLGFWLLLSYRCEGWVSLSLKVVDEVLRCDFNALPASRGITVAVLGAGGEVVDCEVLNPHRVRVFVIIACNTSSPLDGAVAVFGVTASPDAFATSATVHCFACKRVQT
jgi:hypothetical protein